MFCTNCSVNFNSQASFYRHRKQCVTTINKKIFKICVCGNSFYSQTSFYVHRKSCEKVSKKNVLITCDCSKAFYNKSSYKLHKKSCSQATKSVLCSCGKSFENKTYYCDHKKSCVIGTGTENDKEPKNNFKCQKLNCFFSCSKRLEFLDHITNVHSIDSCWEEKTFQTYEEFEDWKEKFEKSTKAAFVKSGERKTSSKVLKYFSCNRSGNYTSKSKGKRAMKSQGLSKIGYNCTACIKVQLEENPSIVKASICNLHYGHENKLSHLRISKSDRALLANELSMGIEQSHILRNLFTECPNELQRQHYTTKVDLRNISKAYGINKIEKHSSEEVNALSEEDFADNTNDYEFQSEVTVQNDAECQNTISESHDFDESYIFEQLTRNMKSNLSELKNDLVARTLALSYIVNRCDNKDLLLRAREHINSAASLLKLKSNIDARQSF